MILQLGMFETLALAVLAIYLGNYLRKVFPILKKYCLPASVVGGTIFAVISMVLYYSNVVELSFEFKAINSLFYCIFFAASGALEMPTWAHLRIPEIDYQAISYYADPTKKKEGPKSMEEVDPELIKTFNKLGIPLEEQMALSGMAVDAVMDSVSVKTTFKETLMEKGIIFCSFSEAVREHPDLVKKYMGSVVGYRDNFFAALNSAVFSDAPDL